MTSAINPRILKVLMSSALYWAFMFLLYWSNVLQVDVGVASNMFFMKGAAFLGSTVLLIVVFAIKKASDIDPNNKFISIVPLVLAPLAPLASLLNAQGIAIGWWTGIALWFLTGVGIAMLLVIIGRSLFIEANEDMVLITCISVFISCLICIFVAFMDIGAIASAIVMIGLCWGSYFIWFGHHDLFTKRMTKLESERVNLDDCDKASKRRFVSFSLQLCFYSTAFSFALMSTLNLDGSIYHLGFIWFGVFCAGLLILLYTLWLNRFCSIERIQWILLAATVMGLVVLSFASLSVECRFASCAIIMFSFTAYDMLSLPQLVSLINADKLAATKYFSLGRFSNASGMFLGWCLAALLQLIWGFDAGDALQAFAGVLVIVMVGIIVLFSAANKVSESSSHEEGKKGDSIGAWMRGCEEICKEYHLSARERDVMLMYAKGRDVNYICEALFVSNHTVKSHVYHIFQKMEIHSQQDLISMVEQRAHDIRSNAGDSSR